ncbi:MAG TPA: FAD-binding oxidoreductase [Parafilimonas sp.]|nr:FAD-binding oxidoreductase [Parafilimonas sp.]
MSINRRNFLKGAILLPGIPGTGLAAFTSPGNILERAKKFKRVRPGDAQWPSPQKWEALNKAVNGNLVKIESPLAVCNPGTNNASCDEIFRNLKNPYFIGDNPALTQTSGWLDAWASAPSVYAVAAKNAGDVAAAVNFARENNLRVVIKGGGHSYQGTSCSADSLLIWTRAMNKISLLDDFVAQGCKEEPQPAVSVEAGCIWMQVYNAVTTKGGRYVQGGGCATVGVAGLIQSGGFGSFSKNYGMAAASLLEAEVVTADGKILIVNACNHPELFWALKGGGGGSLGVVTKLILKTHQLPEYFGVVFGAVKAKTDTAFLQLISSLIGFYQEKLFNPHWGEQVRFSANNIMNITMLFHGLNQQQAEGVWKSFKDELNPDDYEWISPLMAIALPAQRLWDSNFLKANAPNFIESDNRPDAPGENIFWKSNKDEAGQFLYAYHSAWLPSSLLEKNKQPELAAALFAASRYWTLSLHFNKGLAGAPEDAVAAAGNTATNPEVLNAFALAIIAGEGKPAFAGIDGHEPNIDAARNAATKINNAMNELLKIVPGAGAYVSESNFFQKNWQQAFWGSNYSRLSAAKKKYDPQGLFFVHHGVGSEDWSEDGFTKIQ